LNTQKATKNYVAKVLNLLLNTEIIKKQKEGNIMGAARKSASVTQITAANTNANITAQATIQPSFNQNAQTKAQRLLYRDMRLAERCILSPDDELYGIAIPSIN